MLDYADRCKAAATAQGLDPLVDALFEAGVTYEVQQTGGFCMTVVSANKRGTLVATNDGGWFTALYPDNTWHEGPAEAATDEHEDQHVEDVVVRFMRHHIAAMSDNDIDRIIRGVTRLGSTHGYQIIAWNLAFDEEADRRG